MGVAGCEGGSAEVVGKRNALRTSKCRFRGRCSTWGTLKCRFHGRGSILGMTTCRFRRLCLGLRFFRVSLGLAWSFLGGLKKREGVRGRAQRLPPQCKQSIGSMLQSSSGIRRIKRCSRRARQRERGTEKNKGEKQRGNTKRGTTRARAYLQ